MHTLVVPEPVRRKAEQAGATDWLEALPEHVSALESLWDCRVASSLGGGTEAFVAEVHRRGESAVIKIPIPSPPGRFQREAAFLRHVGGDGCVQLLDADEAHGALLLERLGEMLADTSIPLRDQHAAMCDALVRVWRPAPALGLPSGADHARALHALIPEHWERLGRPCGEAAIAHALHCCERREAAHDSEQAVLVHGDVHPWNALRRLDGPGVKLVDPDGLVAERELDLGVLMREHPESLLDGGDPFERARRLAALTATSADAIWEWGVAERVSTGLVALGIGLDEAGRAMLATADAIARNRR